MPPKKKGGGNDQGTSPSAAGCDCFCALSDDVLRHVLSFLPAEEAVRTCVLACRWRHLWETATTLHIVRRDMDKRKSVQAAREFVDHLLLLRVGSPIDTCELSLSKIRDYYRLVSRIKIWIRHILKCKVQVLSLDISTLEERFELNVQTLLSGHLKRLQLSNVAFENRLLDFSCCPALEILDMDGCSLWMVDRISSQSLKCLSISRYCVFSEDSRTHIYTPNVHSLSLRLEGCEQRTPMLYRMPYLVEAFVNICYHNLDSCGQSADLSGDCGDMYCGSCYLSDGHTNNHVLLQGLSEARNLALVSESVEMFIFRRDLKLCPVFGNLKTLLLNEYWCMPDDFSALAYMLEHSPVLEKLTLQLFCNGPKVNST